MSNPVARSKQLFQFTQNLPAWERATRFDLGVQAAALRAEQLQSRAKTDPEDRGLLAEALRALDLAHVELVAARNELRKQADELLATRLEREVEWTRYRDLFEAAPLPYLETDLEGIVIEANRCSSAILQVPPARLIGKPILSFIALSDRRALRRTLATVAGGLSAASISVKLQPPGALADVPVWVDMARVVSPADRLESVRWMFVKSRETSNPAGNVTGSSEQTRAASRACAGRCVRALRRRAQPSCRYARRRK